MGDQVPVRVTLRFRRAIYPLRGVPVDLHPADNAGMLRSSRFHLLLLTLILSSLAAVLLWGILQLAPDDSMMATPTSPALASIDRSLR